MDTPADQPPEAMARRTHTLATRWMHWLNFPLLAIMLWSGLRIYNANDVHAIDLLGIRFRFFPQAVFEVFEADRRLAKGIAYHLTFGWLFAVNGVAYGTYLWLSGRWRDLAPDRFTWREVPGVVANDLHLRDRPPTQGKYNAAQRLAYSTALAMGAIMLVTGFAIYKPVQLRVLVVLLGGYEVARLIHFTTSLALVAFFGLHVLQVARAGWGNFAAMVTGYRLEPTAPGPDLDPDPEPDPAPVAASAAMPEGAQS